MCPAHIAFCTPKKSTFTWTETFKDVENAELEHLIIECRGALYSLEAELAVRQKARVDTNLEHLQAKLQEKARTINNVGALSHSDKASLEEAGTFLEALRSDHIDSCQTRETRKDGTIYRRLLWLISRVVGSAYALLLVCSVSRARVERLKSIQIAILVKYVAENCDSLSSRALEEKANDYGLRKTGPDATSLLERASGKRKRGQSDCGVHPIAWMKRKVNAGLNPLNSYYPSEMNGLAPPESDLNSGILATHSNTSNDGHKNAKSTVLGNDIDCDAVVVPQNQIATLTQSSPRSHDRLQDGNWSPANEAIVKDVGSRPPICEDGTHNFQHTNLITISTIDRVVSSTQPRDLPETETLSILQDCFISDVAPASGVAKDSSHPNESENNPQHPKAFTTNPRSYSAVLFNQRQAQPVIKPVVAPNLANFGLKEHSREGNNISAMRMCNGTHLNPQPALMLAQDGLIKIKSSLLSVNPVNLYDFYVHSICAGRTPLKDNAYFEEVLAIAKFDMATNSAMIALASSYYKEYLPDGSARKEQMEILEGNSIVQATEALERNPTEGNVSSRNTAKMLLIHHAILNQRSHPVHWTKYLYQLQDVPDQQSNLIMARHSIWLMTILPLNEKHRFQTFNYDWVGCGEQHNLAKVNGILGTSRKMLHFEYLITTAAKASIRGCFPETVDHKILLRDIEASSQWVDVTESEMATRIATKTAGTYKLATKLYAFARLCRFTPEHSDVREICGKLTRALYELPASGEEYTGLHPAWCFPIACACTEDPEEYAKMDRILETIGNANKSNVSDLSTLVRWIWKWKKERHLGPRWWEEMTEYLDSMMSGNLFCVS